MRGRYSMIIFCIRYRKEFSLPDIYIYSGSEILTRPVFKRRVSKKNVVVFLFLEEGSNR